MTFLKKLGAIIANVAGIAVGLGPLVAPFLGSGKSATVVNDLTSIGSLIAMIEAVGNKTGLTGAQKLQGVIPLVENVVKTSELVSGKKIADDAKFTLGCQEIAQGVVDVLQSIHPDEAKS